MAMKHIPRWTTELTTFSQFSDLSQLSSSGFSPTPGLPSTFQPTSPNPLSSATLAPSSSSSGVLGTPSASASTTAFSVTLTLPSTTLVATTFSVIPDSASSSGANVHSICAGQGLDAAATGVISSLVLTATIGFIIWLIFAILRPKIPSLYAAREWFVQSDHRPPPLRSTPWAFLSPPIPLVPALSARAPFASDGELAQRTLWVAFLLVLGWTILGLLAALPLYLVNTPCLDNYAHAVFGGRISTLQDLSLLRLLKMYDQGHVNTATNTTRLVQRAIVDGDDQTPAARVRLIILTVLVIVLFSIPALFKLLHEWTNVLACRRRWLDDIHSVDIVWLRADRAPGFQGWGEGRVKDLLVRCGLTSKLGGEAAIRATPSRSGGSRSPGPMQSLGGSGDSRRTGAAEVGGAHDGNGGVDVHGVFTIVDTSRLKELIRERSTVLENLEVAETYYIQSFQLPTSVAGTEDDTLESEGRNSGPSISRPLPLGKKRRVNQLGPGEHGGPTPTTYVAPPQYYKLKHVNGITGGRITSSTDSLAFRISQRVIGSRFQEVTRESISFGRLPLGSKVRVAQTGELAAMPPTPAAHEVFVHNRNASSLASFGPNHPPIEEEAWEMTEIPSDTELPRAKRGTSWLSSTVIGSGGPSKRGSALESVFGAKSGKKTRESSDAYGRRDTADTFGRREASDEQRRRTTTDTAPPTENPPDQRRPSMGRRSEEQVQHRQTIIRPISGLDHSTLALVYEDIRTWRSRLKALNAAIADAQQEAFTAIAEGQHVKGWILIGRNVRYLAGVEPIEGRAKADIRWDELQLGKHGGILSDLRYWIIAVFVAVLLAASLVPVAGLALAGAPDVAHFLPFLRPLSNTNNLGAALATTLAPAVAATIFITLALLCVNFAAHSSGATSVSAARLKGFKATFYVLTFVATVWIVAVGALIFGMEAFDTSTERTRTVANGTTYIAVLFMVIILNVAVIAPGLQMLQPVRLWKMHQAKERAITPRQRFRAIYPKPFNPIFASACCVLAVIFASTFSVIFPLIGPPIVLLMLLSLIAFRYLVGYVWSRTEAPSTGGLLQLWLLRRFATLLALQPLLLGLILFSRRLWALAGILFGAALVIVIVVESYCGFKLRNRSERQFSPIVRDSLATFRRSAHGTKSRRRLTIEEDGTSLVGSPLERGGLPRGSIASVLEMMNTEDIDDLVSTERAVHTYPGAAPVIPSRDRAAETASLLYSPELLVPPPIIWLPHDRSGIARTEAYDLSHYHDLEAVVDPGDGDTIEGGSSGRPSNERAQTPKH